MMPLSRKSIAWLTGFITGLIVLVVLPMIWPESNYLIPGYWKLAVGIALVAGGAVVVVTEGGVVQVASMLAVGVLCAYAIRVTIDIHHDRTNHNLLPFEFVLDFVALWIPALIGGFFGALATRETAPRR